MARIFSKKFLFLAYSQEIAKICILLALKYKTHIFSKNKATYISLIL